MVAAGQLNSAFKHVLQLSRACVSLRQKTVENKLTCAIMTFKDGEVHLVDWYFHSVTGRDTIQSFQD